MSGGGTYREEEGEHLTRPEAESFVKLLKLLFEPRDSIMVDVPLMREALFEVEVVVVEKSATHPLSVSPRLPHTHSTPEPRKALHAHRTLSLDLGNR